MLQQFIELLNRHAALIDELQIRHANRAYHNWDHVLAILALASRYAHLINETEAFFWMAVFHDVIYDSERPDNEERSAALARELLVDIVPGSKLTLISLGIVATAKHAAPKSLNEADEQDIALFLDCDLAILGTDAQGFQAYDAAIREEYSWVDEPSWRAGRAEVMKKFLNREQIYFTPSFHLEFEALARRNLTALIKELSR